MGNRISAARCRHSGAITALLLTLPLAAHAIDDLRACMELQGKAPSEQVLECYSRAAQRQLDEHDAKSPPAPPAKTYTRSLAEQWTPSDERLHGYKQIYYLFYSHSSRPNDTPTSPNPNNQVPPSYALDKDEMKFQISVKGHMMGEDRTTLWFGYTQLSFWQFYDWEHSQPFRENNFEPELILSHRPQDWSPAPGWATAFINTGIVHHSNGQVLPRSRGWNRIYMQAGLERDFGDERKLAMLPRLWKRLDGGGTDDDNPDIEHYLGHGDLELRYQHNGKAVLTALLRIRSVQLDLALSSKLLTSMLHSTNLHLQYFNGYGESLIDYNQRHHTLGIGISMPFE
ncbi:MAG: phospholipase A [Sideroxyarcus sp.]|nr:phospholipase A [Sideroxyarcus sp.]